MNRRYIVTYLVAHPCVDCGESRLPCLEFDHRVPSEKLFTIGLYMGAPHTKMKAEIAKCDVRCANCHRIRHSAENFFYRERASS